MTSDVTPEVEIREADFSVDEEYRRLRGAGGHNGACVLFSGLVREHGACGDLQSLELEHYPGMTERAIESMIDEASRRFRIRGARVVHRVGTLAPGDQIVLVVVTSAHRGDAFAACEFLMDYLKTQAPFWKKEQRPDGSAEWVDARVADDAALVRWGLASGNAAQRR